MTRYKIIITVIALVFGVYANTIAQDNGFYKHQLKKYNTVSISQIKVPYIQKCVYKNKTVILFGTNHTYNNPNNEMFIKMEENLQALKPQVILTENFPVISSTKEETINESTDVGYCSFYGVTNNIPVQSWDLDFGASYYMLAKKYSSDEILLMNLSAIDYKYSSTKWNTYEDFHKGKISTMEMYGYPIKEEQKSVNYYYKLFEKHFKKTFNSSSQEEFSKQLTLIDQDKKLKEIRFYWSVLRDSSLIANIKQQLNNHDRIFVQAGSLHIYAIHDLLQKIVEENQKLSTIDSGLNNYFISSDFVANNNILSIKSKMDKNLSLVLVNNTKIPVQNKIVKEFKPKIHLFEDRLDHNNALRNDAIETDKPSIPWCPKWDILYQDLLKRGFDRTDLYHYAIEMTFDKKKVTNNENMAEMVKHYRTAYEDLAILGFPFSV